jgi:replication-associated recombination protein RarA
VSLVIHPVTEKQLANFRQAPAHAVLLVGPTGSGKRSLAFKLVGDVLAVEAENHPQVRHISSIENKAIGIEAVRELEQFLALKVPGQATHNRAIVIENAHLMTIEAQNALLKTLEEPPKGTILVLTASQEHALLPTIRSRAQLIAVNRPSKQELERHFSDNYDNKAVQQTLSITGGLPGLMHALLDDEEHPLREATTKARQMLSQTAYERLLMVDELSKNKVLAADICFILQQMAHISLQSASGPAVKRWQAVLSAAYDTAEALQNSAQPKLALANLMLLI